MTTEPSFDFLVTNQSLQRDGEFANLFFLFCESPCVHLPRGVVEKERTLERVSSSIVDRATKETVIVLTVQHFNKDWMSILYYGSSNNSCGDNNDNNNFGT